MSDDWTHITGFKPFISLWYEAVDEILKETDNSKLTNDIKLFAILRAVVLDQDRPVFIRSHKLQDFNKFPEVQTHVRNPYANNIAKITWVPNIQPSQYGLRPSIKVAKNIPSPVSYCKVRNTKMLAISNRTTITDNCIFKQAGIFTRPAHKIYTVIDDNFSTNIDDENVLYPVSDRMMNSIIPTQGKAINLRTFQELTGAMYKKLKEQEQK